MLPLACVCGPVLAILIAGLLADRSYLDGLRRMQRAGMALSKLPAAVPSDVAGASARPAA